jgi:Putative beta-barrel porin-2, OmpL-like. bbp2
MRYLVALFIVLGLVTGSAAAGEPAEGIKPAAEQPKAEQPKEPPAEGTLFRALGGESLTKKTGIKMDNLVQLGWSRNSASDATTRNGGTSNFPIGLPGDEGFQLQAAQLFIHRDIKTNILPRITPTPGPVPKNFDWGFMAETVYGRNGQPCRMYGYDMFWGVNEPGASNPPAAAGSRENFLCTPNVYMQAYLPLFKGIALTGGRFGAGIGNDIPPAVRPTPDFFYSRPYTFYSQPDQVFGFLASANVYRSEKNGFLAAEFGVTNGWQGYENNTGGTMNTIMGALRWRSPHMSTWIDYAFIVGDAQTKNPANAGLFMPLDHVLSPRGQKRMYHSIHGSHDFNAHWKLTGEFAYGRMDGDGKPDTLLIVSPAPTVPPVSNFKGAQWSGFTEQVIYTQRKGLAYGFRFEHFRNPDGFALYPLTFAVVSGTPTFAVKGNLNDVTWGIHYDLTKYMMLRPEVRYDWQSNNHGVNVFGAGTSKPSNSQVTGSVDLVLYF